MCLVYGEDPTMPPEYGYIRAFHIFRRWQRAACSPARSCSHPVAVTLPSACSDLQPLTDEADSRNLAKCLHRENAARDQGRRQSAEKVIRSMVREDV